MTPPAERIDDLLATAPDGTLSLDWLQRAHDTQLHLCGALEEIADSLPDNINRQRCLAAAKALGPLVHQVHRYEETVVFPALERQAGSSPLLHETLSRLKFEHCEDECFAEELVDALQRLGRGDGGINIEATGYMLRGFFETMRRHIAFEKTMLYGLPPLAG
ncbi:hemerythrin domain-containing protein [Rhizobium sp. TRM95111]|uniref:hemerythrin domain-containing protein n=1 Tax=Rhizobium alarense TaxID=2846851 RepID=UPI001F187500|nr:hemerythrin domain-containing protein [Rhizobium alarense]MCF3640107.1 hemerythrin domain-containing protein [Rhizobium alarense]